MYICGYSTGTIYCSVRNTLTEGYNLNGSVPTKFALEQNYPNPFNPVTKIQYAIPSTQYVRLKVLDVLGREVATLVNEVEESGHKSVDFDANNLSSGIYFYRLIAGSFVKTNKMVVLK